MNILVIKHGALGDIAIATAGFRAIRDAHPQAHITLLTTKPYAELMAKSLFFDEIWIDSKPKFYDRKAILRLRDMLRSKQWDWVYDLQISGRSTLYPWLLPRPWPRISNVSRFASHGFTDPIRHERHALDNIVTQLNIAGIAEVGMPDISWMNEAVPYPLPQRYALLVPGGAEHRPEKRWPAEQYASLADELVSRKIIPLLIGTKAEAAALDSIATRVPQAINLGGKTSIPQIATLARNAVLAVGNDTGPMHVIAAANCASLVLFSAASNPVRSAPKGANVRILRETDLRNLSVDKVLVKLPNA